MPPPEVSEPGDSKLLMTNPSREPEEQRPRKPVRIILAREVSTTPEETAKLPHRAVMDAVAEMRTEGEGRHGPEEPASSGS
jgi:hypothetical protein